MHIEGGCYCGAVRYEVDGDPLFKIQCHCRECQYCAGGGPNYALGMPEAAFRYTKDQPAAFSKPDLENPVSREFCATCGTPILTRAPGLPGTVILKVGSMDDPSQYEGPLLVIYTSEMQAFHLLPEGVPAFERFPG